MNRLKWFFMSGRKKLLYAIKCAKVNKQRLHLENGIVLDFSNQPIFKVGQPALFKTTQSDLLQYNDSEVIIKRLLTEDECDIDEVGFMYEVTTNGETFQAFEDELL